MKSSQDIISIIRNQKYLKKLRSLNELDKLKLFLPLEMRKAISYITYKNNKLLFAFSHPSFANEFNHYNYKVIKESLKTHQDLFPNLNADVEVQAFLPKNVLNFYTEPITPVSIADFKEHSNGGFKNLATNPDLKEKFESIREIILKNLEEH